MGFTSWPSPHPLVHLLKSLTSLPLPSRTVSVFLAPRSSYWPLHCQYTLRISRAQEYFQWRKMNNKWVPSPKSSLVCFSVVEVKLCLFIHRHLKRYFVWEKVSVLWCDEKREWGWKWGIKMHEVQVIKLGWCSPSQEGRKMLLFLLRNDEL